MENVEKCRIEWLDPGVYTLKDILLLTLATINKGHLLLMLLHYLVTEAFMKSQNFHEFILPGLVLGLGFFGYLPN